MCMCVWEVRAMIHHLPWCQNKSLLDEIQPWVMCGEGTEVTSQADSFWGQPCRIYSHHHLSLGWNPKTLRVWCAERLYASSRISYHHAGTQALHAPCIRHLHGPRWCSVTALTKGLTRYLMGGQSWAGLTNEVLTHTQSVVTGTRCPGKGQLSPRTPHTHAHTHGTGMRTQITHTLHLANVVCIPWSACAQAPSIPLSH